MSVTVIVTLEVDGFDAWHDEYGRMHETREAHGECGRVLYRDVEAPDTVVVVFTWTSLAAAKGYFESDVLRASVKRARGKGAPRIAYLARV